jgi:hypothetical protein
MALETPGRAARVRAFFRLQARAKDINETFYGLGTDVVARRGELCTRIAETDDEVQIACAGLVTA